MSVTRVKQVIGIVLLTAFCATAMWKLYDSFGHRRDGDIILFFIFLVFVLILLAARRIFRY